MTVKEFYLWAKKNGYENFEMVEYTWDDSGPMRPEEFQVNEKKEELIFEYEC